MMYYVGHSRGLIIHTQTLLVGAEIGKALLQAIWHSFSKPLKLYIPLDPADLHLENYPKETT